jgi:hypothetical protein
MTAGKPVAGWTGEARSAKEGMRRTDLRGGGVAG